MSPIQYLFVYGSLRKAKDGSLHRYLQNQTQFIDTATLNGKLFEISGYPGAVVSTNCVSRILGEVYRIKQPEAALHTLDHYEECSPDFPTPHEYRRIQKIITLSTGKPVVAWVYVYCRSVSHCKLIVNGDYAVYLPQSHR